MHPDVQAYNNNQSTEEKAICDLLAKEIDAGLPDAENKIWHTHPVWFLEGNPIVGYSKQKGGIRLLFWSVNHLKRIVCERREALRRQRPATQAGQVKKADLKRWLKKARDIQWDYKNIVKRKGGAGKAKVRVLQRRNMLFIFAP